MRSIFIILLLSPFMLSTCGDSTDQTITGTWELNEISTPDGEIEKDQGITKLILAPDGVYSFTSIHGDVIVTVRGVYRLLDDFKITPDRPLLMLIDQPFINSFGDTITHYTVSEIICVSENSLVIKHQTLRLPSDSLLKFYNKREFYKRISNNAKG